MSEILSRVAPGRRVRRGAVRDARRGPGRARRHRAAGHRARLPARADDPAAADARHRRTCDATSAISRRSGCGPSASSRSRPVHEEDWATAWKEHFPVLRVGRRIVIRPTWRDHRADAGRRRPRRSTRAWPSGPACIPSTRLCLAGIERWPTRAWSTACACSTSAADRASWRSAPACSVRRVLGVDTDPIAVEVDRPERGRATGSATLIEARRGSLPLPAAEGSTSSSPTSSPVVLVALAGQLAAVRQARRRAAAGDGHLHGPRARGGGRVRVGRAARDRPERRDGLGRPLDRRERPRRRTAQR